jgi:hypothetical protein
MIDILCDFEYLDEFNIQTKNMSDEDKEMYILGKILSKIRTIFKNNPGKLYIIDSGDNLIITTEKEKWESFKEIML